MNKPRPADGLLAGYLIGAPATGLLSAVLCVILRCAAPGLLAEGFPADVPPWGTALVAATLAVGLVSGVYLFLRRSPSTHPRPFSRRDDRVTLCFCLIAGLLLSYLIYIAAWWGHMTRRKPRRP